MSMSAERMTEKVRRALEGRDDVLLFDMTEVPISGLVSQKRIVTKEWNASAFQPHSKTDTVPLFLGFAIETRFDQDGFLSKKAQAFKTYWTGLGGIYIEARDEAAIWAVLGDKPS